MINIVTKKQIYELSRKASQERQRQRKINKSKWITEKPKLFEYESINKAVDVFVREDPQCPFPFHEEDWYHQGYYLKSFIIYLNDFFERFKLPFKVNQLPQEEH